MITHIFVAGDSYLASDAVFGVKQSLITGFAPVTGRAEQWQTTFDSILEPVAQG